MKTIKANFAYRSGLGHCIEYTIGKHTYSVDGEFYYNTKKNRMEHLHEGPKGGKYLVIFQG